MTSKGQKSQSSFAQFKHQNAVLEQNDKKMLVLLSDHCTSSFGDVLMLNLGKIRSRLLNYDL